LSTQEDIKIIIHERIGKICPLLEKPPKEKNYICKAKKLVVDKSFSKMLCETRYFKSCSIFLGIKKEIKRKRKFLSIPLVSFFQKTKLTVKGAFYIFIGILLLCLSLILPYPSLTLISALILLFVSYQFYNFSKIDTSEIYIERIIDRRQIFRDDYSYVRIIVINNNPTEIPQILIEDFHDPRLKVIQGKTKRNFSLIKTDTKAFSYFIQGIDRGTCIVGPIRMLIKDRAGIFFREELRPIFDQVIIFPKTELAKKLIYASRIRRLGKFLGVHRSKSPGIGIEFFGLREYTRWDDYRWIDWKSSARLMKLMVKEFEAEIPTDIMIMLDASYTMGSGSEDLTKYEYGLNIAIFLANLAIEQRDRVGYVIFSDRSIETLHPKISPRQIFEILRCSAAVIPSGGKSYLEGMKKAIAKMRNRGIIFIITDLEGGIENLIESIKIARIRKHRIFVIYLPSYLFEKTSYVSKTEHLYDPHDKLATIATISRYNRVERWLSNELRKRGAYFIKLDPETNVVFELERFFKIMSRRETHATVK